ncbi:MAG: (Fe-S)-binding protein [Ruminococcaceae bacterium]|nr:(Fe-S)-binding protein [Oscillospiraceae bacterium]
MQFTQKAREHIESCRFCWMCHHICPIGNATGLERNTARARALGLSLVARDAVDFSEDIVSNVYECALCGGCVADCTTGWDPVMFTKEARLGAALDGKLPSYIMEMLTNFQNTGNVYGLKNENKIPAFPDSDTLFFIGEDTRAMGCAKEAVQLLQKAGVDFTVLQDEPNSGYSLSFLIGAAAETKAVMETCAASLAKYKRVICYDPADAKVMKREYKEWGIDLKPEVITFTAFLAEQIENGSLKPQKKELVLTPQDSPLLARDLEETAPMRTILSACGAVREMLLHGKETMLAGNLIMNEYMPRVMEGVAENRWNNARNMNAEILVTACPAEYILLSKTRPEDLALMKIEEVVLQCL